MEALDHLSNLSSYLVAERKGYTARVEYLSCAVHVLGQLVCLEGGEGGVLSIVGNDRESRIRTALIVVDAESFFIGIVVENIIVTRTCKAYLVLNKLAYLALR